MLHASRVIVVCLPAQRPISELVAALTSVMPGATPVPHFRTPRRLLTTDLLHARKGCTAGGPRRLLDFTAMAAQGLRVNHYRHWIWQQVVHDTPAAHPFWHFADLIDAGKLTAEQAHWRYLAQPRIAAMRAYSRLPHRAIDLPTSDLEAFQAGCLTYCALGELAAVPAGGVKTLDGRLIAARTERLSDVQSFLEQAHDYLGALPDDHRLVAVRL